MPSIHPTVVSCDGRPLTELLQLFTVHTPTTFTQLSDEVTVSNFTCMSLQEYVNKVLPKHFEMHYKHCDKVVNAANMILSNGLMQLAQVFKTVFPSITYHSHNAKRLLMKMPIVSLQLLHPESGVSKVF